MQITFETIISIIAIITSVISLLYTIYSNNKQKYLTALIGNLSSLSHAEDMIGENQKLLEFHGISPNELKKIGISNEELAYLLSSFTAGSIYFRTVGMKSAMPFHEDSYRYRMLKSIKTRKAWLLVRQFMEPSPYRDSIEATIALIEKNEKSRATE